MSKLLAEDLADFYRRRHGLEVVGLRIPLVLGPGLWYQGAAAPLNQLAMQAMKLAGGTCNVPSGMFDALHVKDIGALIENLINHAAQLAPIYNVAGFTTSYSEIRQSLIDLVSGFQPQLKEFTPEITYPLVSQAMLENDTGWQHRLTLKDTLQDILIELKKKLP
jgi:UDP-glucose 4-epimerase